MAAKVLFMGQEVTKSELVTALVCIKKPFLEGRMQVVVRKSPHGALYRAERCGKEDGRGPEPKHVKLTFMADLNRTDLREIVARAAQAAYTVACGGTNAQALMEYE